MVFCSKRLTVSALALNSRNSSSVQEEPAAEGLGISWRSMSIVPDNKGLKWKRVSKSVQEYYMDTVELHALTDEVIC